MSESAAGSKLGRLLTPESLWPLAVLACLFAFVSTHPVRPHDFWWHLDAGRDIARTGQIPQVDQDSYTAFGQPYPSYNIYWLADWLLYQVHHLGGTALNVFAHTLLITGTYLLLYLLCRRLSGDVRIATVALVAAAALGFENWNLRPQAISFLLFTLTLWLIYAFRTSLKTPRWLLLAFPLLMVVWVNCHGSFPLLIVLVGTWLVETAWERWRIGARSRRSIALPAVALALSAAAVLLNPQGLAIFDYLRQMGDNPVVQNLPEWTPASLATKDGIAFFILAPLGLIVLLWAGRAHSGLFHWLMFIAFALLALRTGRAIIWFGLVLAPLMAELLPRVLPPTRPARQAFADRAIIGALMIGFLALMVITLPWFKNRLPLPPQKAGLISAETPVAATNFLLQHHLPPQLFHDMAYGSYLIWQAAPRYRVFVDPRIELYPARLWDEYHAISRGEAGWEERLRNYGVRTAMLDRQLQAGLVAQMQTRPQWSRVYEDPRTTIFVYDGPRLPIVYGEPSGAGQHSTR